MNISKKPKRKLFEISKTPEVIVNKIFEYVPIYTKQKLNKELYVKHHYNLRYDFYTYGLITGLQKKYQSDSYLKFIIQNDYNYIFSVLLLRKHYTWLKPKKILYKKNKHRCFLSFLCCLCEEYKSQKCLELIQSKFKDKNLYRNVVSYNNKWTN